VTSRLTSSLRGLLLAVVALAGCKDPGAEAVRAADTLFAEGRWEEAAVAYAELPDVAGEWQPYGSWRAAALYRDAAQDIPRAEEAFAACARRWPDHDWGYTCQVDLADMLRDAGRPRDAIGAYRAAVELRPRGERAEHCLLESGRAYLVLGDPEQARVEWDELLRTFPRSLLGPTVALEAARSFELQGDSKGALAAYRGVQERFAQHDVAPLAAFGEGEALEQLGRLDEAVQVFEAVRGRHPNPAVVDVKLAAVRQRRARREQEETAVMDRGVILNKDDP